MKIFRVILLTALLFAAAPACERHSKDSGEDDKINVPDDETHVDPSSTTLLDLFKLKIAEYRNDATIPTNHVFICAHRANTYSSSQKQIPENSVRCIEEAIAQGADMVELDVRVTSDGVPMLMHDEKVNTTTNGKGTLSEMTFDQVRALRMKYRGTTTPYREDGKEILVPTLAEALKACKGKIYVNLDVKDCPVSTLMKAIRDAGVIDEVMIYGLSTSEKKECIVWAFENVGKWIAVHPYIGSPDDYKNYVQGFYDCAKLFQYNGATYYNATVSGFGYKCHANGVLSYSNSLDYDSQIRDWYTKYYLNNIEAPCRVLDQFIASGSDFVQTDVFELAQFYFKSKGLR